jgi:pimeloyl-ACP methyl ester carboxylesterase
MVVFERSGHYPFVEEPETFRDVLRDWFGRRTADGAPVPVFPQS